MGFLGLGNFGTGFVTGFAQSVDRAVQDDMKRVQDRIDKLSDIRVQRFIKEQDEREDEVEKYRKALEKGAAVLGGVENAAFQMKKLGNDIGLYNQFVNAFSQEKSKYGYEFNDFLKNMDSTPINPAQVKKTFTAKEYAGSIVPQLADPSTYKIPEGLTGTSGNLLTAILGKDRIKVSQRIQDKTSEELAAYGVKPTNDVANFPTLYFDDESYNLAKIENVEDKLNYLDQKILNPRLVGTEESRKKNPKSDENIMFEKLTSLKRGILKTSSESMNIDVRINVNTIRLGDLVPNTDEYNLVAAQLKEDKIEKMRIEASNSIEPNAMLNFEISKTQIELNDVRQDTTLNEEEKKDKTQTLQDKLTTLNYELKTRLANGETIGSKLENLKNKLEKNITKDKAYVNSPAGIALRQQIEDLTRVQDSFNKIGKPTYNYTHYSSALSQYAKTFNLIMENHLPKGITSVDSQGIKTFNPDITDVERTAAMAKLKEFQIASFFGGEVLDEVTNQKVVITQPLINASRLANNPEMYYAYLDVAASLGINPPKGFNLPTDQSMYSSVTFTTSDVGKQVIPKEAAKKSEVETETEKAFLLPFQQGKTDVQVKLAKGRQLFPNNVDGINALIKQTIKTEGATADLKSKILDSYSRLYPATTKENILNYINNYKFDSIIEQEKRNIATEETPGEKDFEALKPYLNFIFPKLNLNEKVKETINNVANNKLSNEETDNVIEVVMDNVKKNIINEESIKEISNVINKGIDETSELDIVGQTEEITKIEKSPVKNIAKFENEIYGIYAKLGLENLSFRDLSANDIEIVKKLDNAKTISELEKIKLESMDKLRLNEDVYKVLDSKVNKTIEQEVENMSTKELTKYTKGLVKKVNNILENNIVKPNILNKVLTTSRLGDFGETFEPDLSLKDVPSNILSADEMNEINTLIAQGGPSVQEAMTKPEIKNKIENKVSKALNVTFGKSLDELIAASKIVESKILGGEQSMDNPELTNFILETFLPNSVKNSIKARNDGSLLANSDDLALALKYVSAFTTSPTLENLKGFTGDIRNIDTPVSKPVGLMSRQ